MLKRKVYSNTRPHWQLALEMRTGWPYGDFGNFLNGFAKSARFIVLNIDWVQLVFKKLWNTAFCPRSVMYKKYKRLVYMHTPSSDLLARICKVNLWNAKEFGLICFRGLIYCDQEPLWLLNVIEDVCCLLGVHIRLSTRCKMFHYKIT